MWVFFASMAITLIPEFHVGSPNSKYAFSKARTDFLHFFLRCDGYCYYFFNSNSIIFIIHLLETQYLRSFKRK